MNTVFYRMENKMIAFTSFLTILTIDLLVRMIGLIQLSMNNFDGDRLYILKS